MIAEGKTFYKLSCKIKASLEGCRKALRRTRQVIDMHRIYKLPGRAEYRKLVDV